MATNGKHGPSKRALRKLYQQELDTLPVGDPARITLIEKMAKLEGIGAPPRRKKVEFCTEDGCGERATHGTVFCASHRRCWYEGCDAKNIGRTCEDIFCKVHADELAAIELL